MIEYNIFSPRASSAMEAAKTERNEIWRKVSLRDEDDARTSNTGIVQRKRANHTR